MEKLLEFAIIGIATEIEKREKMILKGRRLISRIENGENVGHTIAEIKLIIAKNHAEIEQLAEQKFNYEWDLSMMKK